MKSEHPLSYRLGIFLAICGLCATLPGCVNKAQPNFERPPAPVVVATAVSQDVSNYMDALGKIVARETVQIQPQVSGRITQIHFTDGANVRKGQLLFTIDPRPFEANLKQAQANLAKDVAAKKQAEANLAREVARENWGRAQVERYRTLVEQGVVAKEQYEQLRADYDTLKANSEAARAAVHSADETVKADNAAIETSKVQLSYCYIHSPIDGRAGQRLVDIGNVVNPGGLGTSDSNAVASNALLVIERINPIYADFTISQNKLSLVQDQMRAGTLSAEVRLPDAPGDAVSGQLTFIDNSSLVGNHSGRGARSRVCATDVSGRFIRLRRQARLYRRTAHRDVGPTSGRLDRSRERRRSRRKGRYQWSTRCDTKRQSCDRATA
jgi:multidrug efflux system membrane fusion protein